MRTPHDPRYRPHDPDCLDDDLIGWDDQYVPEQLHRAAMHREAEKARARLREARKRDV